MAQNNSAHLNQPQFDESTLIAMQQHMAQQAAFQQIPDVVKSVRFHARILVLSPV